jgi:hypothetical protein
MTSSPALHVTFLTYVGAGFSRPVYVVSGFSRTELNHRDS